MARASLWLFSRIQSYSGVSRDDFFGLRMALPQNLVQEDDRAKGCCTDTPNREAAKVQGKVASTKRLRNNVLQAIIDIATIGSFYEQ